jgi:hypothetical protein
MLVLRTSCTASAMLAIPTHLRGSQRGALTMVVPTGFFVSGLPT